MPSRIVLGMGAGPCGLATLAAILARQPAARISLGQAPLLPWVPRPDGPGIRGRVAGWRAAGDGLVGDVAASYLPYAEAAIAADPDVRMICLERPEAEVVAAFRAHLDASGPVPLNHWAREPGPRWTHHPLLTPTYPQYDVADRDEGLSLYWREYHRRARDLAARFPANFRVVDGDDLLRPDAVRALLDFAAVPRAAQVVATGRPGAEIAPAPAVPEPLPLHDPRRCAVLVPYTGSILPECEEGLRVLERRGYPVRRVGGYAAIDQGRNQMATDALVDGFEETLWIDSDIGFDPDDVEVLRRHGLPIVGGIYPQKGRRAVACHVLPGTPRIGFGAAGGLLEILYAGGGFLQVRREVYLAMQRRLGLPVCNERFGRPSIPYFCPMVCPGEDGPWYLAEDFAFCERARRCGYKIMVDTTIRLWHLGACRYGWEDAGIDRQRFRSFNLDLT